MCPTKILGKRAIYGLTLNNQETKQKKSINVTSATGRVLVVVLNSVAMVSESFGRRETIKTALQQGSIRKEYEHE